MRQPYSFPRWSRQSIGRTAKKRAFLAERLEERRLLTADPIVTIDTNFGNFQIELFPAAAPKTVANFLSYVESGAYTNSIFHRSVPNFIVQSGGFTSPSATFTNTSQFASIPTNAPIPLEYNLPNVLGSIAMARTSAPNSATDEWFINTVDNSSTLGPSNGGGYAVFGQVLGNGMQVIDTIAGLPTTRGDSGAFSTLPLGPGNQLVRISSMTVQFAIEGTVFTDFNGNGSLDSGEAGVAGRTVFLDNDGTGIPDANNPSTMTDASGHYVFNGLAAGTYTVREAAPANVTVKAPSETVTVSSSGGVSGVNFAEEPEITGTLFVDLNGNGKQDPGEPPLAGQTVLIGNDIAGVGWSTGLSTTTDANGRYAFTGLPSGTYVVVASAQPGAAASHVGQSVALSAGATVSGIDLAEVPSIAGKVFDDANANSRFDSGEQGVAGRIVNLKSANGSALVKTTTTDANGEYWFLGLPEGTYTVAEELPAGLVRTTRVQVVSVPGNIAVLDVNLGETPQGSAGQLFLNAVYRDILDRDPDATGLAYWTQQLAAGVAPSVVAAALAHSGEYYANFVVKPGYQSILGRAADAAGLAYWSARLGAGVSDQEFEAALVASDEFYAKAGDNFDAAPDADDTSIAESDHNADWVAGAFQTLLHRMPETAASSYWLAQLTGGLSREQAALAIAEGRELKIATIDQDYAHYLNRPADPAGEDYWLKQFADGKLDEDLIAGIAGSAEYYRDHTA